MKRRFRQKEDLKPKDDPEIDEGSSDDAPEKRRNPAMVETAHTRVMMSQRSWILPRLQPLAFIPVDPAMDSGRFEMNTATSMARLTFPPWSTMY